MSESSSNQQSEKPYIIRTTRLSVLPASEPIFSEKCTHVTLVDNSAGEYLEIEQQSGCVDVKPQTISIDPEEWPALRHAIDTMMGDIKVLPDA